jgi:hypothetical protein
VSATLAATVIPLSVGGNFHYLTTLDAMRLKPSGQLPDGRLTCAIASADVRLAPVPCQSIPDCRQNDLRQKTHFASRLNRMTLVQSCCEKYFDFAFSEIDVS